MLCGTVVERDRRHCDAGVQHLHLAGKAPEEERDAAPNVHRVLVTLNWRKHLPFDLAYVGSERLAQTALAVRLDLGARGRLHVLAQLRHLRLADRVSSSFRTRRATTSSKR